MRKKKVGTKGKARVEGFFASAEDLKFNWIAFNSTLHYSTIPVFQS
jgi:hypothetical protein